MNNIEVRKNIIKNTKKIVVKVGTKLLTDDSEISILIPQIALLKERGLDVTLVSSGAVGMGMKSLGLEKRPMELPKKQALAALGQCKLMAQYEVECKKYGFHSAQLLLTADAFKDSAKCANIKDCIAALCDENILPIVNENDSVATEALKFGDNDNLATQLGIMLKADLIVLLTTVDGLHSLENGELNERISVVEEISSDVLGMALENDDSTFSIGGMESKLKSAQLAMDNKTPLWIADGRDENIIKKLLDGQDEGTIFIKSY